MLFLVLFLFSCSLENRSSQNKLMKVEIDNKKDMVPGELKIPLIKDTPTEVEQSELLKLEELPEADLIKYLENIAEINEYLTLLNIGFKKKFPNLLEAVFEKDTSLKGNIEVFCLAFSYLEEDNEYPLNYLDIAKLMEFKDNREQNSKFCAEVFLEFFKKNLAKHTHLLFSKNMILTSFTNFIKYVDSDPLTAGVDQDNSKYVQMPENADLWERWLFVSMGQHRDEKEKGFGYEMTYFINMQDPSSFFNPLHIAIDFGPKYYNLIQKFGTFISYRSKASASNKYYRRFDRCKNVEDSTKCFCNTVEPFAGAPLTRLVLSKTISEEEVCQIMDSLYPYLRVDIDGRPVNGQTYSLIGAAIYVKYWQVFDKCLKVLADSADSIKSKSMPSLKPSFVSNFHDEPKYWEMLDKYLAMLSSDNILDLIDIAREAGNLKIMDRCYMCLANKNIHDIDKFKSIFQFALEKQEWELVSKYLDYLGYMDEVIKLDIIKSFEAICDEESDNLVFTIDIPDNTPVEIVRQREEDINEVSKISGKHLVYLYHVLCYFGQIDLIKKAVSIAIKNNVLYHCKVGRAKRIGIYVSATEMSSNLDDATKAIISQVLKSQPKSDVALEGGLVINDVPTTQHETRSSRSQSSGSSRSSGSSSSNRQDIAFQMEKTEKPGFLAKAKYFLRGKKTK